jgi:hypothetical protein
MNWKFWKSKEKSYADETTDDILKRLAKELDILESTAIALTPPPQSPSPMKPSAAPGYQGSYVGLSGWSGTIGWNPKPPEAAPIIETAKYYWIEERKTGKMFIGLEEHLTFSDGSDGIFWRVYGRNADAGMYESGLMFSGDDKEMLLYYEVVEEICPPTTTW